MPKVTPIKFVPPGPARLSYVNLFEPAPAMNPGDDPVRSVSLLYPETDTKATQALAVNLMKMVQAGVQAKLFNEGVIAALQNDMKTGFVQNTSGLSIPIRNGSNEVATGNRGKEYQGMYFINAKSWRPVGIVDGQNMPIMDPDELYSGCWANAQICFKCFNTKGNKGVRVEINLVQKVRDDERFDGVDDAANVFDVLEAVADAGPADTTPLPDIQLGGAAAAPSDVPTPTEAETKATQGVDPAGGGSNPFANLV